MTSPYSFRPHPNANLKRHYLSRIFGDMAQSEFDELVADIKFNGQLDPIVVFMEDGEKEILDGWHRYHACLYANLEPEFTVYRNSKKVPPDYFAVSKNLRRRQSELNAGQRAILVVKAHQWRPSGKANKYHKGKGATNAQMAEEAGVSWSTIMRAKRVSQNKVAAESILQGETTLHEAFESMFASEEKPEEVPRLPPIEMMRAEMESWRKEAGDRLLAMEQQAERIQWLESLLDTDTTKRDELYGQLEQQVQELEGELAEVRSELQTEMAAKMRLERTITQVRNNALKR